MVRKAPGGDLPKRHIKEIKFIALMWGGSYMNHHGCGTWRTTCKLVEIGSLLLSWGSPGIKFMSSNLETSLSLHLCPPKLLSQLTDPWAFLIYAHVCTHTHLHIRTHAYTHYSTGFFIGTPTHCHWMLFQASGLFLNGSVILCTWPSCRTWWF